MSKAAVLTKKICATTLRLAATQGWENLTLDQIAKATKISLPQLKKIFANKNALLAALVRHITVETAASLGTTAPRSSTRDRLFEIIMARIDVLQKHRKAILSIMRALKKDSCAACALIPAQHQAMADMLALAGLEQKKAERHYAAAGLWAIYLAVLYTWSRDQTLDMSKTMAVTDRYLRFAEHAAEILFRRI